MLPTRAADFVDWPFGIEEMAPHYEAVARLMPIAAAADGLADQFPLHAEPAPPLRSSRLAGWLLVAYGSKLVFQNAYTVPWALMRRELRFKELSIIRVIANLVEAVVKVGFAWGGMPIWCFILGPIARNLVTGVGVLVCHPWRPRLICDVRGAREHVGFALRRAHIVFFEEGGENRRQRAGLL